MFFNVNDDVASVLLFDAGVALMFIVFSTIADRERLADRILFGSATILSLVLYISWRWLDTLPDLEMTGSSLWAYLYFTFETVSVVYALGSIFILFRVSDWTPEADDAQQQLKAQSTYPSVDVFICTYNEPINILENPSSARSRWITPSSPSMCAMIRAVQRSKLIARKLGSTTLPALTTATQRRATSTMR